MHSAKRLPCLECIKINSSDFDNSVSIFSTIRSENIKTLWKHSQTWLWKLPSFNESQLNNKKAFLNFTCLKTQSLCVFLVNSFFHTINAQDQRCWWTFNAAFGDRVGDYTGVIPHIRGFHFRDVEIARLLGHKSPRVLGDIRGVLIEDPCEAKFCERNQKAADEKHMLCLSIAYTHIQIMCASSAASSLQRVSGCLQG